MPAVNPSLDPIRSRVNLTPVSRGPLRLPSNFGIVITAISFLFALQIVVRYKRYRQSRTLAAVPPDSSLQHMKQTYRDRSRGVSNTTWAGMSANRHPSPLQQQDEAGHCRQDGQDGSTRHTEALEEPNGDIILEAADMEASRPDFLKVRPPLPLPMTPPRPAISKAAFEERRLSRAHSSTGDLDSSFFSQPNPDYGFDSSPSSSASAQDSSLHTIPRRRSYTKTLPLGPPQPVSWLEDDGSLTAFSPSSLPLSSPALPPAPHDSLHGREVDVKGEIISVLDHSGAGWMRHTRVYGGGVCLACLASSDEEGGFYGARVRQEEKR